MNDQQLVSLLSLVKQAFFSNDKAARRELAEWFDLVGDTLGASWLHEKLWVVRYRSRNNLDIAVGPYLTKQEAEENAKNLSKQFPQNDRAWIGISAWVPGGNKPMFRSVDEVTIL